MANKKLKLIFAGTPEFSVPTLNQIHQEGYQISLVLTQPDRKAGRGMFLKSSAVKQRAKALGIPILQPIKLNNEDTYQKIKAENADILIVAAYGLIIPSEILNIFIKGSYNVHASLLPSWRGAAPIHRAIESGDKEIGVTIMSVIPKLDAGDIVRSKSIALDKNANSGDMTNLIAELGAELMVDVINDINNNKELKLIKQNETKVTYANKINKLEAKAIWKDVTSKIMVQKINAFNPFPGVFCNFRGKILKIWKAKTSNNLEKYEPGELYLNTEKDNLFVGTKDGSIEVKEIQLEGKRKMTAKEFISANKINGGELFL
jgi:methionyl-tRNA formyltransferase